MKHGHTWKGGCSPTYSSWRAAITRCTNPKAYAYELYGGAGLMVCDRWRVFENFLADMGPRPAGTTLDRRDNSKGYEPGNCRWATKLEQAANQRQHNAEKTHCPAGHPYAGRNLLLGLQQGGAQRRRCRICISVANRERHARKRA